MAANGRKSYHRYLNKLYINNTYQHSINENLLTLIILLWLKKLIWNLMILNLKLATKSELLSTFSKAYTENLSHEIFIIDSALKTNPWT